MQKQENNSIISLMKKKKTLIGVIHLDPLPGSTNYNNNFVTTLKKAIMEAQTYSENGADAIIIENFGDRPLAKNTCDPATIASMSIIASKIWETVDIPIGINLLRNCGIESLAVAYVSGASFIRVNAYSQTVVTDQGVIEPIAYELQRYRRYLNATDIEVLADINVKHAKPLVERGLEDIIHETTDRALADAIILTGEATGKPPEPSIIREAKKISPKPVIVGSGVTLENIENYLTYADGFIIGSFFRVEGKLDPGRIRSIAEFLE